MNNKVKILYLYSELVGYQIPIFKTLHNKYNAIVKVVCWDKNKLKPYEPPTDIPGVEIIKKSEFDRKSLLFYALDFKPEIVYISGWMDKDYLFVVKYLKKLGCPIVTGFDDMWIGSLRQKIGSFIFPFFFKRRYYTHAWVAGPYQFEFAKRIGFKNSEIIFDLLSANTNFFITNTSSDNSANITPKFLYAGNFRKVKGTDILIKAYRKYKDLYGGKWGLTCIGNGEMENELCSYDDIEVIPFSSEEKLRQLAKSNSVFVLPSRHDQWGVVIHEFTSLGLPLLISDMVGAKATFFIDGYNGFSFLSESVDGLCSGMLQFEKLKSEELRSMSDASTLLSKRISIESSAANLISILYRIH